MIREKQRERKRKAISNITGGNGYYISLQIIHLLQTHEDSIKNFCQ